MKIIYDKNMAVDNPIIDEHIVWHDVSQGIFDIYGFDGGIEEILSQRLPKSVAETVNEGVLLQSGFAAGGRVRFYTDSMTIAVRAEYGDGYHATCLSACAAYGFDLYTVDEAGRETFLHTFRPAANELNHCAFLSVCDLNGTPAKEIASSGVFYTLNMPCFAEIKKLYIGLLKGSTLKSGQKYVNEKPVIFYGSSITHGAAASRPGNTYEAFISQKYNLNYINLGFAGRARGEREMAQYIAEREISVFVCDYDYNAPDAEHLQATHYPFYEVIREKHPKIPYIMISKPNFRNNPQASAVRRDVIKASYEKARANGDENVYFIDGETLFTGDCYMSCTVDGSHPNDLGFYRMADVIGKMLAEVMGLQ